MNDKDYYIKKVIAVLGAGEKRFREMFREAEENGILLHMIGAEEFKSCFGNSDREIEGLLREEGSLWVTDDRWVSCYFFDRSENILIWIHEQNMQEDFSRGK